MTTTTMSAPPATLRRTTLRASGAADATALRALADAHFADLLPGLPPEVVSVQSRARDEGYRQSFPCARELVIEVDGEVAGRLLVDGAAPAYHLVDVVVHPARRGSGVGTAALRAWLADVDREAASVTLRVAALSPARRWYERHGFTDDATAADDPIRTTMRREASR